MSRAPLKRLIVVSILVASFASPSLAETSLFGEADVPLRGDTVSAEPFVGFLRGTAGEYVYSAANPKTKISQLDWSVNTLVVGGRLAVRPFDNLTLRGRFWASVSSDGDMKDYDYFGGFYGKDSWTHKSTHSDTRLGRTWQADGSVAWAYYGGPDLALTAIAGFRHYQVEYNAYGGSYLYSTSAFRDTPGSFSPGELGISYRQTWQTPYVGLGAAYNGPNWAVSAEVIGSPFVMARDRDYHALRTTLFKGELETTSMVGFSAGMEYRLSDMFSISGRLDYQYFLQARGGTTIVDGSTGIVTRVPSPSAGADADMLTFTLGAKMRI